ncbi:MAG: TIGR04076 family protein [Chloroflexi bacterium]|nr:TIGR04076 family protein [Chloroflexota bacterium]
MSYELPKCKVTVLKKMLYQDLADEYREDAADYVPCERFQVGQEIIIDHPYRMPENFCTWAWADIRKDILAVATGSDLPWMKQRGVILSGCTDWIRPVIFKIEQMG